MRFMNMSLANLTNNLSEITECKCGSSKDRGIHTMLRKNVLICKCKTCTNRSYITLDILKERFPNLYKFRNGNNDKFVLLLGKGVYPYEYMDSWERFNETELPDRKEFRSNLNKEDITKDDYKHAQKVWKTCNTKNLGDYDDVYVQADTLQLGDVFKNFRKKCINIYRLDPAYLVALSCLSWQVCLKMTKGRIRTINRYRHVTNV